MAKSHGYSSKYIGKISIQNKTKENKLGVHHFKNGGNKRNHILNEENVQRPVQSATFAME